MERKDGLSSPGAPNGVTRLERRLARRVLELRGDPQLRLMLWNGEELRLADVSPVGRIVLRERRVVWDLLRQPGSLGLGEAYASGRLEIEGDLTTVLKHVFAVPEHETLVRRAAWAWQLWRRRSRQLAHARANVHHHYDLGNDFYAHWLDEGMSYTCAYFPTPSASLEEAQAAKQEHVARKLWLRPGERVVEAGCGWGSLALHMARAHGVKVTAYNVSSEQIRYAREQAHAQGLADRVEFREDDYRNITGEYDVFVSVGMLEHVGPENYAALGSVIDRCLGPHGRGLVHSIGRVRRRPMDAWISRRIFPGAYSPTLEEMVGILAPHDFAVLDVEDLRLHYERTLIHWLERFEKNAAAIERRFDARFVRMWRLYLAGSIAAFHTSSLQLWQVAFARARSNAIPWTRANLYAREA
jgi:cyclopropane-fatty-acyl-phospholipid synthase